jgi:NADPH:quinone reductase-like Zn-dependent oxidoreductase
VAVVGLGGLGHLGLQYSKATGHHTTAVTHSRDKEKQLRDLGADAVVADGAALQKAGGADVILATSNSFDAVTDAIQALRPDGRLVIMGVDAKPLSVPTSIMWVRGRIIGSSQNDPSHLYEALQLVAAGKVKVMTETYHAGRHRTRLRTRGGRQGPLPRGGVAVNGRIVAAILLAAGLQRPAHAAEQGRRASRRRRARGTDPWFRATEQG